jgi:ABC-type transporter MlaC component
MTLRLLILIPLALVSACVDEPTPKQAEAAAAQISNDDVKQKQRTIEQAAEEATRLIEQDAQTEIDQQASDSPPVTSQ